MARKGSKNARPFKDRRYIDPFNVYTTTTTKPLSPKQVGVG